MSKMLIELQKAGIKLIDGDRGTRYPSKEDFYDKEYCLFLDTGNITAKGFDFSSTHFITQQKDSSLRNGKLERNDIVMTTRGSVGNVALYDESVPFDNVRINSGMIIIRCGDSCSPQLLYYLLQSPFVKKQINDMISGSVQKQLPVSIINRIKIIKDYTSMNVRVIYDLDRKIKLNNEINTQLEELARTIYDYWFLQFEFPNEEGKPYKSSGGKMVYNEQLKREIPEGWEVKRIKDLCKCCLGGTPSTKEESYWNGDVPWLNSSEISNFPIVASEKTISQKGLDNSSTEYMPEGTIVISITGNIRASFLGFNACANQSVVGIYENKKVKKEYLYQVLSHLINRYALISGGNCQKHINKAEIENTFIIVPDKNVLGGYYKNTNYIYSKIVLVAKENKVLSSLRDFLLPLLMNGQVTFKKENEKLDSEIKQDVTIPYLDGFNQWKQIQGYAARGEVDDEILKQIYDAMDEDDKK